MAEVKTARRYYLMKRIEARLLEEPLESAWQAKQEAEPGEPLPATFPFLSKLTPVGYKTRQDLDGADADELVAKVGLSHRQAKAVIAAFTDL